MRSIAELLAHKARRRKAQPKRPRGRPRRDALDLVQLYDEYQALTRDGGQGRDAALDLLAKRWKRSRKTIEVRYTLANSLKKARK